MVAKALLTIEIRCVNLIIHPDENPEEVTKRIMGESNMDNPKPGGVCSCWWETFTVIFFTIVPL